jgi:zinc/manganese transport system substrate-binding protein
MVQDMTRTGPVVLAALGLAAVVLATGCAGGSTPGPAGPGDAGPGASSSVIRAIGAENEYADVVAQIGGRYVQVSSILDNPNTDPHTFESSPAVAREVSGARLIVQNGLGYDGFMDKMESASPSSARRVIVVQHLLGLPDSTPNPHLWYDPKTMPAVASAAAGDLAAIQPAHAAYFRANAAAFDASLAPLTAAIAAFRSQDAGAAVATTEPVADYLLDAMGMRNLTPFRFQADIMNGTDPTPQDITLERSFFTGHRVKVFCYNEQVVDDLTSSFRSDAVDDGVPVVGVYETMPTPGYHYQSWMLAEVGAIQAAVTEGRSTARL